MIKYNKISIQSLFIPHLFRSALYDLLLVLNSVPQLDLLLLLLLVALRPLDEERGDEGSRNQRGDRAEGNCSDQLR